jgi:hypothetical protein
MKDGRGTRVEVSDAEDREAILAGFAGLTGRPG